MSYQIGCIGECMVEMSKRDTNMFAMSFGGDTANTAVYLSRLLNSNDVSVEFVSAVGDDPYSEQLLQFLKNENVGVKNVTKLVNGMSGLYFISTDEFGERTFHYYRSNSAAKRMFLETKGDSLLKSLKNYQWIYLTGISLSILDSASFDALLIALKQAKASGSKIVFDGNYRPAGWPNPEEARQAFTELLKLTDIALVTFDDEESLFGDKNFNETIERLRTLGVEEGVVKLGAQGCVGFETSGVVRVVVDDIIAKPVDTTAAGDSFNAGYLSARSQGASVTESAELGNKLASRVIQYHGAIIDENEMMDITGRAAVK